MNLLASLNKPYTDTDKQEFINSYYKGTNFIKETKESLEAWEYTEEDNYNVYIPPIAELTPEQKEESVAKLTMTALDFINFLRSCGIQLTSIRQFLDNNLELDTQLKYCQNVYCQVAESVMPIEVDGVTITPEMVRQAFINKAKGV